MGVVRSAKHRQKGKSPLEDGPKIYVTVPHSHGRQERASPGIRPSSQSHGSTAERGIAPLSPPDPGLAAAQWQISNLECIRTVVKRVVGRMAERSISSLSVIGFAWAGRTPRLADWGTATASPIGIKTKHHSTAEYSGAGGRGFCRR